MQMFVMCDTFVIASELLSIYHFSFCFIFRVSVFFKVFFFPRLLSFNLWCSRSVVCLSLRVYNVVKLSFYNTLN